jgi:hypothetical protein
MKKNIDPALACKSFVIDELLPSKLRWRSGSGGGFEGEMAGCLVDRGHKTYWTVRWNGQLYYCHRIIWAIQNQTDPAEMVVKT